MVSGRVTLSICAWRLQTALRDEGRRAGVVPHAGRARKWHNHHPGVPPCRRSVGRPGSDDPARAESGLPAGSGRVPAQVYGWLLPVARVQQS